MQEMLSLEDAQELVLSRVEPLSTEVVSTLDVVGRVSVKPLKSDIDVSSFAHAAMDGYALFAKDIERASKESPVQLDVVGEIPAGKYFDAKVEPGQCVRIMTGAPVPEALDSVVKYEIVDTLSGSGTAGTKVAFTAPTSYRSNVREAGEEAKAGETIVEAHEVIGSAGVGFLASCGIVEIETYRRPRVAVMAIGSELVPPTEKPGIGKIRNSNSYAIAACVQAAGGISTMLPGVDDDPDTLAAQITEAVENHDFVVTTGGASDGDYDFIKPVVESLGDLLMTTVNMRPGKAQTFGVVKGVPVFGLPGNPAAAYLGFEMIIRAALRKMQGYTHFHRPKIKARLGKDVKKRDPRRIFLRSTLYKDEEGGHTVIPATNQSSGLFGVIQKSNCMAIIPEGLESRSAGSIVDCILLDVPEELSL